MTEDLFKNSPDTDTVLEKILENRTNFIAYQIARLREVMRYLPEEKLNLFYTIPLLVHMNSPDFPGYLDNPSTPHGIYRFFDSGFWEIAKKHLEIKKKDVHAFVLKKSYVKGLYLMGSLGTLGQTEYSDLDYWVLVDTGSLSENELGLLRQKLGRIEKWSNETYGLNLKFFVVDVEQIQQNNFSGLHEEGSATGQKTILKDEFYRTFLLIAGQIPYWAVLPAGLNNSVYRDWIKTASHIKNNEFLSDDYVDLGDLTSINREECTGAILWQALKAFSDPVKALIKSSLIACYYFFQDEGLLSDIIKRRLAERRLDSYFLDPYALVFERAARFYDLIDDKDGLNLIKECIFLRLTGYPVPMEAVGNNPKQEILQQYINTWSWGVDQTDRLKLYSLWTENKKLQHEERLLNKISFLYQLICRAEGKTEPSLGMAVEDLTVLKNRTESHLKKKPGKIARCSTHLRVKPDLCPLFIDFKEESNGAILWAIHEHMPLERNGNYIPLFIAPKLLHVLGWIVVNRLCRGEVPFIMVKDLPNYTISQKRIEQLLKETIRFFSHNILDLKHMRSKPLWQKVFVFLDPGFFSGNNTPHSIDYLAQNTWGELYLFSIDISHIENSFLKCYEIAKLVRRYLQEGVRGEFKYRISDAGAGEDSTATKTIEDLIKSSRNNGSADLKARQAQEPGERSSSDRSERSGPLLDRF